MSKDSEFNLRLCRYAIQHLASEINRMQKEIIDVRLSLTHFPETTISDYSLKWKNGETFAKENECAVDHEKFLVERLTEMKSDYEFLAGKMEEYGELRRAAIIDAMVKGFKEDK